MKSPFVSRMDLCLQAEIPYMHGMDPRFSEKVLISESSVSPISQKTPYVGRQSSQFLRRFLIYGPLVSLCLVGKPCGCALGV